MKLQNRRSAFNVTTYKHSIMKTEIANPCQWIQVLDQCLAGNRYLWCAVFFRAKLCDNSRRKRGGRINGMWSYHNWRYSATWRRCRRDSFVAGLSNQCSWGRSKHLVRQEGNPKWETTGTKQCPGNLTSGRFSLILSTLNASWDDISSAQQKYYIRKAREAFATTLSVISPGQEKDLWKCIQNDSDIIGRDESSSSKRKHFDTNTGLIDVLIKTYDQAESWQTKRQILSLFANDFSHRELQMLIPGLT